MPIELRWVVSIHASVLHATAALLEGARLVDDQLSATLADEARGLAGELAAAGLSSQRFFEHVIPLSVQFDSPGQLTEISVAKIAGRSQAQRAAPRLANRLQNLYAAFELARPKALEELELRAEPLKGQWEARGPGLMAALARFTEPDLLVDAADAIVVHPVLGGGGAAHPLYNSLRIEAVLANPVAELPEVTRLGWLLAQLNLDLSKFEGELRHDRLFQVGRLALIPPLLAAAEEVELARNDIESLTRALAVWGLQAVEPDKLAQWWETYQSERPPWAVALGALDRMLSLETPQADADTLIDRQ
jgi:hypothetical protein